MSENGKQITSHTLIPTESCNFTWSIENFSFCGLQDTEHLTSPKFSTGQSLTTTWNLHLFPNHKRLAEKVNKEYVAIFLKRNSTDSSSHYATFKISIIDSDRTERYSELLRDELFDKDNNYWGHPEFIERDVLFGLEKSMLLPQDVLTVMCDLKCSRVDDCKALNQLPSPKTAQVVFEKTNTLISDLQHLYDSNLNSDLTVKVGDEELKVHKVILCARSSVFNAMLNVEMKEKLTNCIEITDFDPPAVKKMLRYIYTGKVDGLTLEIGIQLFSAAEKYDLQDLKDICFEYLSSNVSVDNFCDVLELVVLHDDEDLLTVTRNFFCSNVADIRKTEKWRILSMKKPALANAMYEVVLSKI